MGGGEGGGEGGGGMGVRVDKVSVGGVGYVDFPAAAELCGELMYFEKTVGLRNSS